MPSCQSRTLLAFVLFACAACESGQAQADASGPKSAPVDWYANAKAASVEVIVDGHLAGSGWFAHADGYAITAAHVIGKPGKQIELVSPAAGRIKATVVAVDRGHDAAVLRVEPRPSGYPALPFAKEQPTATAPLFLLGSPVYRHALLLRGWVARPDTSFEFLPDQECYARVIYATGVGPIGTSGGPWLDRHGLVVGLQSGIMTVKGAPTGVSFVVPASSLAALLKAKRNAATPTIHAAFEELWEHPTGFIKKFPRGTQGIVVRRPRKDGPLAKAGVKEFDAITHVDGRPVPYRDDLLGALRTKRPGQRVRLTVLTPEKPNARDVSVGLDLLEKGWEVRTGSE